MQLMDIIENSELEPKNLTVEELFHIILHELGFSYKIRGTYFLEDLFNVAYDKYPNTLDVRMMELYQIVADMHNTNHKHVSRAISYTIDAAWDKGNTQLQNELFSASIDAEKGKPTAHEFICFMIDLFKL